MVPTSKLIRVEGHHRRSVRAAAALGTRISDPCSASATEPDQALAERRCHEASRPLGKRPGLG